MPAEKVFLTQKIVMLSATPRGKAAVVTRVEDIIYKANIFSSATGKNTTVMFDNSHNYIFFICCLLTCTYTYMLCLF